ncbi:hypothetical protein M0802_011133 [Mischocyttarus mexicanus]|nr:hypothetical protein M0802_011133 [Mischocyttarus mexicanus]
MNTVNNISNSNSNSNSNNSNSSSTTTTTTIRDPCLQHPSIPCVPGQRLTYERLVTPRFCAVDSNSSRTDEIGADLKKEKKKLRPTKAEHPPWEGSRGG